MCFLKKMCMLNMRQKQAVHWVKGGHIQSYSGPHFSHLNWIWIDTPYLSVFNPNVGKCVTEQLRIRTLFTQWLSFQYISIVINLGVNKNKLCKTLGFWFRYVLNLNFPEKGMRLVSPPHFMYDFSRKMFLMLLLLADRVSLSDCLYLSRYWTISVLQLFTNETETS